MCQLSEGAIQQGEQLTQGETEDGACHAAAEPLVRFPWQTAWNCAGQLQATVAGAAVHAVAAVHAAGAVAAVHAVAAGAARAVAAVHAAAAVRAAAAVHQAAAVHVGDAAVGGADALAPRG